MGIAVEMGASAGGDVGQRIAGRVLHRCINTVLLLAVQAVEVQRVVNHLIIFIDGQLQGVHRRGVALGLDGSVASLLLDERVEGSHRALVNPFLHLLRHLLDGVGSQRVGFRYLASFGHGLLHHFGDVLGHAVACRLGYGLLCLFGKCLKRTVSWKFWHDVRHDIRYCCSSHFDHRVKGYVVHSG